MSKRSSNLEMHNREKEIIGYLQDNVKISVFCDILSEKYECTPSTIRKQYEKIMKDIRAGNKEDREMLRSTLSLQLDLAYQMAKDTENPKTMIDTVKEKARLHGLYEKEDVAKDSMPKFIEYGEAEFKAPVLVTDKVENE